MVKSCKSDKKKFPLNFNVTTKEPERDKSMLQYICTTNHGIKADQLEFSGIFICCFSRSQNFLARCG